MASFRQGAIEIKCEVCESLAARAVGEVGEAVINRGDICVNLAGEQGESSRLSALRPELACLPKMRLCANHLREQRRKDGGEWVTITDASAMLARRDKKEMESLPPLVQPGNGGGDRVVSKLMESLGAGAGEKVSPQILLRRQIGK